MLLSCALLGAPAVAAESAAPYSPATRVAIVDGCWHLNGAVTCRGTPAEGLLMNVRMVNSVFADANDRTRPAGFEAEANTDAFIARIPEYVALGVRAFTLNLQGGQCGWEGAVNSAFNPDGTLGDTYLRRVRRVIEACDRHGAVVILGCYYQRQDQHLRDEAAVRAGVVNAARWIHSAGFTNVLLEIANEFGHRGYDHAILKSAAGQADLIRLAKQTAPDLLVSTSGLGNGRAADEVIRAADFILIHFNDTKLTDYAARLTALRGRSKPIVCNEDDKVGEAGAQAARNCVAHGASWGFMHSKVNQYYPFRFQGRADDPVVYAALQTLTAPANPRRFPGADWEVVAPEVEGVDSAKLKAAIAHMDATWGSDGAKELFIVRNGRAIWVGPNADAYHPIFSCTKTFTSTVLGLLVADGQCGLDDPAVKHLPELDDQYPLYGKIKLRHLASMCGGYRGEVVDKRPDQPWGDVMKYFNPREPYFEAGTHVQYNDHDVFTLGRILQRLTRVPLQETFQQRIAGPIGLKQWEWGISGPIDGRPLNNPPGNPGGIGAGGVKITPRELARFGHLMLNRGNWNGRQLLPAEFVDAATSNQVPLTGGFRNHDFRGRYGYYWWTNGVRVDGTRPWPAAPPRAYMSHGKGGNFCCVVPEWDLVIVRLGAPVPGGDKAWAGFFAKLADAVGPGPSASAVRRVGTATREWPAPAELPARAELPDPLVMFDGRTVTTRAQWEQQRRPELKALFQHYMYGAMPAPVRLTAKVHAAHRDFLDGAATLKIVTLETPRGGPTIDLMLVVPNRRSAPAPVFLALNFCGNHALTADPRVPLSRAWLYSFCRGCKEGKATEAARGGQTQSWPLARLVEQGYALASFCSGDIDADRANVSDGLYAWLAGGDSAKNAPADRGSIAAWAWGFHRCVDYLEGEREVDARRIAAVGHSRNGKAALLAAAFDERIALAIPLQAGCGGSAPSRVAAELAAPQANGRPIAETTWQINRSFPHWFNAAFKQFDRAPERLPFDQHCLVALCAPRPVLFSAAEEDRWANPAGQFAILQAADPVYRFLGVEGLAAKAMPANGELVDSRLGYAIRAGRHSMSADDWEAFLRFANRHFKAPP